MALNICSAGSALHGTGPSCLWEDKVTIADQTFMSTKFPFECF